ncbi:MAG: asparagine synthase (glutamine-hydrolyzing) [Bacteroidetes bacterium]|nr:asparagine synthase (glutamine-hydrolyzing) [Bacteroidota bacterium]
MCGIVGGFGRAEYNISAALHSLLHRGPDANGSLRLMGNTWQGFIGHTRLSILDVSQNGNQPMQVSDGTTSIVYNGEVYNFRELAARFLGDVGLRSGTDTEVVLQLFHLHGPNCLQWLHGDFAFAFYDSRTSKIYLVRDRLGVKPLYYRHSEDGLVFGSELKVFTKNGASPRENTVDLQSYFAFKYFPENRTPFEGVYRVDPGTWLEYDIPANTLGRHRYWEAETRVSNGMAYSDAVTELRSLLSDAVEERLIADVPVGTFLSGGLDSSAIAYFLRQNADVEHHCARKTRTDLRKEGTTSDADYAERLSREWGLRTHFYDIGAEQADEDLIATTLFYGDDLIADGSQIPSYMITKNAASVSKVLLSGMGADEILLGYGGHLLMLLSAYLDQLPGSLRKMLISRMATLQPGKGRGKGYKRFLVKLGRYESYGRSKYGLYSIVGDYERSLSVVKGGSDPLKFVIPYFENSEHPFEALTRFELKNVLVKNLTYLDRMCMANSVEGRVPFMDHRLVEFALSLPVEYRLSPFGNSKRILKDAMKGRLPDYILNRRKAGFGMPLRSIFSDRRKLVALLNIDYFGGMTHFNTDNIVALVDEHVAGVNDNSSILYALVSYRIWRQRWIGN